MPSEQEQQVADLQHDVGLLQERLQLYDLRGLDALLTKHLDAIYAVFGHVHDSTTDGESLDLEYGAPGAIAMGDSSVEGSLESVARSDHQHAVPAFVSPAASAVGDSSADGSSASTTRADHVHEREAFATPGTAAVGDSPGAGASTTINRSDHTHGQPAFQTTPSTQAMGDAAAAGVATAISRGGHKHAMPSFGTPAGSQDFGDSVAAGAATTPARSDHDHAWPALGSALQYLRTNAGASASEWADLATGGGGGAGMDWAIRLTGDPEFPHNGDTETDVTISSNTTWTESDYPGRIVKLDVLTINSGIVLTLQGGPWYLFVASIVFGNTSSIISANGFTSTDGTAQSSDYARGGVATRSWGAAGIAAGGSGAGMLFVVATEVSGAAGKITANGGAGFRNTTTVAAHNSIAGQGAMSDYPNAGILSMGEGAVGTTTRWYSGYFTLLGRGGHHGSYTTQGVGGGSGGAGETTGAGGGSGIGGGGGVDSLAGGAETAGELPIVNELSIDALLTLAAQGCLGGGGGAAYISSTSGAQNGGSGGGGGSVVAFVRTLTTTPTVSANGGVATTNGAAGAAGVAYLVDVP